MPKRPAEIFDEEGRRAGAKSAYAQRFTELREASRALGYSVSERLTWVTKFVGEDQSLWNEATERAYANRLAALVCPIPENILGGIQLPPAITAIDLRVIQKTLRDILRSAVESPIGKPIPIPTEGLTMSLVRVTDKGKKPARWAVTYGSSSPAIAVIRLVADLVLTAGDRLIACRHCGNPIVAVKKQLFCNPYEAQRYRNERRGSRRDDQALEGHHDEKRPTGPQRRQPWRDVAERVKGASASDLTAAGKCK
jgi:hypothetical protein